MAPTRSPQSVRAAWVVAILVAQGLGVAGQGTRDIEAAARSGRFQDAFAQSRAVVVAAPSLEGITQIRALFTKYPEIQEAGVAAITAQISAAGTEEDLLRAQAELRFFVKLVNFVICEPRALAALQARFVSVASRLILDARIRVTFESNLLADWATPAGSELDPVVEDRIYQNTMANIAARDRRDTPSPMVSERLFRYLLRHPEIATVAFESLKTVQWEPADLEGPMRAVYPDFVRQRRKELGMPDAIAPPGGDARHLGSPPGSKWTLPESTGTGEFGPSLAFDTRGVEFGPWVRRFLAQVRRNWFIPPAAMSLRGHVSVSYKVHKDGTITEIAVVDASGVDAFNESSFKAIAASNPTFPLPAEYPDEYVKFTLTFFYNETPPQK